jgi:hypothetical protein
MSKQTKGRKNTKAIEKASNRITSGRKIPKVASDRAELIEALRSVAGRAQELASRGGPVRAYECGALADQARAVLAKFAR